MHISKLSLVNYRNFANAKLIFQKGVNTVIGENGAGKSNAFRALRLLLDDNMIRSAFKMDNTDFHRGIGDWRGHWIIISAEFEEIGTDEAIQALFAHGAAVIAGGAVGRATYNLIFRPNKEIRLKLAALDDGDHAGLQAIRSAISIDDYESLITGRSQADFNSVGTYKELVGDFDNCVFSEQIDDPRIGARVPSFLSLAKEVSFTYIQALRDVVAEFHNNRTNPLLTLLKRKSGEISAETMEPIVAKVQDLNTSIEALGDVQTVRTNIRDTIRDAAGATYSPTSLSIKSDLPTEADRLFQSLRLFIGESEKDYEGGINELSLGGANLIFLTLKLLEFQYQAAHQSMANFLLIEEPEAHIHTHVQKTLFDRITYADTQIIYSTHSTHISEVSKVQSVNILGKGGNGQTCEAYQPTVGLDPDLIGHVQRYLDAVRSNLLFAKSVCLIEGDAEEILIPILVRKILGLSLDELGVSLINIRSTGFQNVAALFHDLRIRKRCAIITDLDEAFVDTMPQAGDTPALAKFKLRCAGAQEDGARRKTALDGFCKGNQWLAPFYAEHTLEVDFVAAGNSSYAVRTLADVYVDGATIATATTELTSGDKGLFGKRMLTIAANQGKGWFAILLGKYLDHRVVLPDYVRRAIFFARQSLSSDLTVSIYLYRVTQAFSVAALTAEQAAAAKLLIHQFRDSAIDLATLKHAMEGALPGDQIHAVLADIQ